MRGLPERIHIEPTNICTLKCPGCSRTRFIDQWPQHWKNHSVDIDHVMNFLDIDLENFLIYMCGNYGDPIYHPEFISLVKRLKQRGARLHITTNGSYKKPDWWIELVGLLDSADTVEFSVDGLPNNFAQYRVNADWPSIEAGMHICSTSAVHTIWKYIPFAFNQMDISAAEQLSHDLGIKEFKIMLSDRFDEDTQNLIPDASLLRDRYASMIEWKSTNKSAGVAPKCVDNQQHYITADGYYSPCCWLADHRFYYKTPFGKHKESYQIAKHTMTEILNQPEVINFYQTLDQQPGCQYNCPKLS